MRNDATTLMVDGQEAFGTNALHYSYEPIHRQSTGEFAERGPHGRSYSARSRTVSSDRPPWHSGPKSRKKTRRGGRAVGLGGCDSRPERGLPTSHPPACRCRSALGRHGSQKPPSKARSPLKTDTRPLGRSPRGVVERPTPASGSTEAIWGCGARRGREDTIRVREARGSSERSGNAAKQGNGIYGAHRSGHSTPFPAGNSGRWNVPGYIGPDNSRSAGRLRPNHYDFSTPAFRLVLAG